MALFKRADLKAKGLTDDQIEYLMTESNRALASDYSPKSDIEAQIAAATKAAQATDYTQTEEYKALTSRASKADQLEAYMTKDFEGVKKPYLDIVWGKLDHGEKHKPYGEQVTELREALPDLFAAEKKEDEQPTKPQFGAPTTGNMPTGDKKTRLDDIWFGKKG